MKITFEWEANFPDIKHKYSELICHFKGHKYKAYKEPQDPLIYRLLSYGNLSKSQEPYKKCERCCKMIYKVNKVNEGRVVKFTKYQIHKGKIHKYKKRLDGKWSWKKTNINSILNKS